MKTILISFNLLLCSFLNADIMINPITDVCWECLFPMTFGGVNITPDKKDFTNYDQFTCICADTPPKIGIPVTFWEPARMIDVTRHAYKLVGLGGIQIGKGSLKNRGSVGRIDELSTQTSFFHVHFYTFPILNLLGILLDFECVEKGDLDVTYMSEFDPLWVDDELQNIFNPEAALFSSQLAQLACIADCTKSSLSKPTDKLFWCAGCQGSLYPFSGHISHYIGSLQASSLLVHRTLAKLHRIGVVMGYEKGDFCKPRLMPIIKKSLYKTQIVKPIPQTEGECHALGKSDALWGRGKTFPSKGGDDFVYLIWMKKQCCLDAVKPALLSR